MANAVVSTMVASYFAAMMLIPIYASRYIKGHEEPGRFLKGFLKWFERLTHAYGTTLDWMLSRRKKFLTLSFCVTAIVVFLSLPWIGTELFPKADAGNFQINFRTKSGTRIERTKIIVQQIQSLLRTWIPPKDLKMILSNIGIVYGYPAAYTPNAGSQDAFFLIELTENREHSTQYYAKLIREKLPLHHPELEFGIQLGGLLSSALNGGLSSPIDVQVGGPSYEKAFALAQDIKQKISKLPGAVDLRIQQKFDYPQIQLDIDRSKSMLYGVTPRDVVVDVVSAVSNSTSFRQNNWIDPKTGINYDFGVQFREEEFNSFNALENIPIRNESDNTDALHQERGVPLNYIASIRKTSGPTELNHVQLQPVIDIYLDAQGRDIGGLSKDIEEIIRSIHFDPRILE
jgi:multidrug efflux pump subunit AcrB